MKGRNVCYRCHRHAKGPVRTQARGRISPLLATAVGLAVQLAVGAGVLLAQMPDSLTRLESRLHEEDPFVEFVDRRAPPFELIDGKGNVVRLDDFRGKTVVLNFIYARCTDICPPHMALLAELQERIRQAGLAEQVELVTLATDTEESRATARLVREYGERFGIRASNWRMLYRGDRSPRTVIRLAAEYGLEFRVVRSGEEHEHANASDRVERQVHGAVFHVIDPAGRMRARLHGMRFEPQTLVTWLRALTDGGTTS